VEGEPFAYKLSIYFADSYLILAKSQGASILQLFAGED
jgi:hypothetical protein